MSISTSQLVRLLIAILLYTLLVVFSNYIIVYATLLGYLSHWDSGIMLPIKIGGIERAQVSLITSRVAYRAVFDLIVAAALFKILFRSRSKNPSKATCSKCGYCLKGLVEPRCPECGTGFDSGV